MTTEERLEALEKELACAKRRNRWSLTGAALVFILGVALCGTASGPSKAQPAGGALNEVRASKFTLVNQDGTTRASLAVIESGAELVLYDAQEKARTLLTVAKTGPELDLLDGAQEKGRASLAVAAGSSSLTLCDTLGKPRIDLGVAKTGPLLAFSDAQGKPTWFAP